MSIQEVNRLARRFGFEQACWYGIDTPESRRKQAEFIRQFREAMREGGVGCLQ